MGKRSVRGMEADRQNNLDKPTDQTQGSLKQIGGLAWAPALAVAAITFLSYVGTLRYEFVYDDQGQIVDNPLIKSLHYFPRYFTDHVWGHTDPTMLGNYYRPIFLTWLMVNHAIFGLNSSLWHLTTLLVHVGVVLMFFTLARRLLKSVPAATAAALLFGLHPAHIESVAWISGVTDPLLALFMLASFFLYFKYPDSGALPQPAKTKSAFRQPMAYSVASILVFVLALLSKETALVLPGLIFGMEYIYGQGDRRQRALVGLRTALPYLILTVPYLIIRALVLKGLGHQLSSVSMWTTIKTWPAALWFYLQHLVWPVNLSCFYDLAFVTKITVMNFVLPLVGLLAVAFGGWWLARRQEPETRRTIAIACLWIFLPLLPVLNLSIFAEGELVHDRYLYLPTMGLALLIGLGLKHLKVGDWQIFGQAGLQFVATLLLALVLGSLTTNQHQTWASNLLLFNHGLVVSPNSRIAKTGLANVLSDRGYCDDAVVMYNEVLERHPTNWKAVFNLGCTYSKMGKFSEAEKSLMRAIELRPQDSRQYISLSVVLQELQRLPDAERAARYAVSLDSEGYGFHYQLGDVLESQGRFPEAMKEYEVELVSHPEFKQVSERLTALRLRLSNESAGASNP